MNNYKFKLVVILMATTFVSPLTSFAAEESNPVETSQQGTQTHDYNQQEIQPNNSNNNENPSLDSLKSGLAVLDNIMKYTALAGDLGGILQSIINAIGPDQPDPIIDKLTYIQKTLNQVSEQQKVLLSTINNQFAELYLNDIINTIEKATRKFYLGNSDNDIYLTPPAGNYHDGADNTAVLMLNQLYNKLFPKNNNETIDVENYDQLLDQVKKTNFKVSQAQLDKLVSLYHYYTDTVNNNDFIVNNQINTLKQKLQDNTLTLDVAAVLSSVDGYIASYQLAQTVFITKLSIVLMAITVANDNNLNNNILDLSELYHNESNSSIANKNAIIIEETNNKIARISNFLKPYYININNYIADNYSGIMIKQLYPSDPYSCGFSQFIPLSYTTTISCQDNNNDSADDNQYIFRATFGSLLKSHELPATINFDSREKTYTLDKFSHQTSYDNNFLDLYMTYHEFDVALYHPVSIKIKCM